MSAAVIHLLRQMQKNGRLAYLIGPGSQSYDLLTQEAAQASGRDVGEFRNEFAATLKFERWPTNDDLVDRIDAGDHLLTAAKRLKDRGFFEASSCADKATNADMHSMLKAIANAEECTR